MAALYSITWVNANGEKIYERFCHPRAQQASEHLTGGHAVTLPLETTNQDLEQAGWEYRDNRRWVCPLHVLADTKGTP